MGSHLVDICWSKNLAAFTRRPLQDVRGIVVHRIEVSQEDSTFGDTPSEITRFFCEHPIGTHATGGKMAYPIVIEAGGQITQTVPLSCITPHAKLHNPTTIGIACVGDFRSAKLPQLQWRAVVKVCCELAHEFGFDADAIHGHDELIGGSSDPNKECPGRYLSMEALRSDIREQLKQPRSGEITFVWEPSAGEVA
jgi:hypothetical protein